MQPDQQQLTDIEWTWQEVYAYYIPRYKTKLLGFIFYKELHVPAVTAILHWHLALTF